MNFYRQKEVPAPLAGSSNERRVRCRSTQICFISKVLYSGELLFIRRRRLDLYILVRRQPRKYMRNKEGTSLAVFPQPIQILVFCYIDFTLIWRLKLFCCRPNFCALIGWGKKCPFLVPFLGVRQSVMQFKKLLPLFSMYLLLKMN